MPTATKRTTKTSPAKSQSTKKAVSKRLPSKKPIAPRAIGNTAKTQPTRRGRLTSSEEYSTATWILISIWLVLIAIFIGTFVGKSG
ncbi:hypothetical protein H7097_03615 [Aeromicrobium sp.]|nr:hypothetical protein [Candidatus Saccharibacteria bacterium]